MIYRGWISLFVIILWATGSSAAPQGNRNSITKSYDQKLEIFAKEIPLNEEDLSQSRLGQLEYIKGWELTSDHYQFGGFSTLLMSKDKIVSISDQGLWLQASFDSEADQAPFTQATLTWQTPRDYGFSFKKAADAESLVRLPYGYLVGYEQYHRIEQITEPGAWAFTTDIASKVDFRGIAPNGGLEAITWISGDRLLAFAERGKNTKGNLKAWIFGDGKTFELAFKPPMNFYPTDAATLPDGDVLILMRRYSPLDGVGTKILRIDGGSITEGAVLKGTEVATFESPISTDNMEGLDVMVGPDGEIYLYVISDNNFSRLQRTLFMIFKYTNGKTSE